MSRRIRRAHADDVDAHTLAAVREQIAAGRDAYDFARQIAAPPIMARTIIDTRIAGTVQLSTLRYLEPS